MRKIFYYKNYSFNAKTGELSLSYAVCHDEKTFSFTEKIVFPNAPFKLTFTREKALNAVFFLAHIAFGISYYKAFCPCEIKVESGILSKEEALFFNRFYESGLGEFAVRNHLNLQGKIVFPFHEKKVTPIPAEFKNRYLIPVGGGKDSCLTIEIMKELQKEAAAISVGCPKAIAACMKTAGLKSFQIKRVIDSQLIQLNREKTVLNGHVPITGMLAFLLWGAAVLYNYKYAALSCERSANAENLMQGALAVNHQYSKSFEFEENFYRLTQAITPNFRYFSLLRPLSELAIGKLFTQKCASYFPVFTSCNKAFRLDEKKRLDSWCGCCDKCRFVYLILAPFMKKETLIQIAGTSLLNDGKQKTGYKELLGLSGHKPFECVGEIEESQVALWLLSLKDCWKNDLLVKELSKEIKQKHEYKNLLKIYLTPAGPHLIPADILSRVFQIFNKGLSNYEME